MVLIAVAWPGWLSCCVLLQETQGVPVATLGSDTFPAFFTRDSGCKVHFPLPIPSADVQTCGVLASYRWNAMSLVSLVLFGQGQKVFHLLLLSSVPLILQTPLRVDSTDACAQLIGKPRLEL